VHASLRIDDLAMPRAVRRSLVRLPDLRASSPRSGARSDRSLLRQRPGSPRRRGGAPRRRPSERRGAHRMEISSRRGDIPAPPRVAGRVATLLLLMVLAISLLLAVPSLRPVLVTIRHINAGWTALAIALELASCVSFVVLFELFFDRFGRRDARALAWTEMASGALLPGGGAGGLAIGGWLMHLAGAPAAWILRRSGGLFFLTSAVNALSVVTAGLLLGIEGSHPFTLTIVPVILVSLITLTVASLPRMRRSRQRSPRWLAGLTAGVADAEQTTFAHPSWRLIGALGYLGFDMAVLWVTLQAVGEPMPAPALILAYNIGYLANMLPIPGGIGVLDAGLAGSLLLYGADPAHVAAAVLVYHAIALWIPGLGGTLAYVRARSRLTGGYAINPAQPTRIITPLTKGAP
jgi:uncharacterized membrane protein YbhN (UPF0104 family)